MQVVDNDTSYDDGQDGSVVSGLPAVTNYSGSGVRLGQVLISQGKLTETSVQQILLEQRRSNTSFGESAIALGLLTASDIEQALGLQYDYTILSPDNENFSKELEVAFDPFGEQAEVFRAIRSQLMMNAYERGLRAVSVISPSSGAGVSYLSANLAVTLAQQGLSVCLVDANLRTPAQGQIFKIPENAEGLSDVLRGKAILEDVIRHDCFPGLGLLASGPIPPNPQEMLGRPAFVAVISQLLREFDIILVDTPSTNQQADGRVVVSRVGSALVLARKDKTHAQDIEALRAEIEENNGRIVGAVLNDY